MPKHNCKYINESIKIRTFTNIIIWPHKKKCGAHKIVRQGYTALYDFFIPLAENVMNSIYLNFLGHEYEIRLILLFWDPPCIMGRPIAQRWNELELRQNEKGMDIHRRLVDNFV